MPPAPRPKEKSSSPRRAATLAQYAHEHRAVPTPSEERLWRALRACQLGPRFWRQVVLSGFILDFLAPAARVVVEVDGGYHARRRRADARRDEKLRRAGCRVLRLEAELVMKDLPAALERIAAALAAAMQR